MPVEVTRSEPSKSRWSAPTISSVHSINATIESLAKFVSHTAEPHFSRLTLSQGIVNRDMPLNIRVDSLQLLLKDYYIDKIVDLSSVKQLTSIHGGVFAHAEKLTQLSDLCTGLYNIPLICKGNFPSPIRRYVVYIEHWMYKHNYKLACQAVASFCSSLEYCEITSRVDTITWPRIQRAFNEDFHDPNWESRLSCVTQLQQYQFDHLKLLVIDDYVYSPIRHEGKWVDVTKVVTNY